MVLAFVAVTLISCNDVLDRKPISQITPDSYYSDASQVESYLNTYYDAFITGPYANMYHQTAWNDGMVSSDDNTDILVSSLNGNTSLFAPDHWDTPSGKVLQGRYGQVRVMNFIINKVLENYENGKLSKTDARTSNALGEAYFLRALCYFNILALYGDAPIVTEVLENNDDAIIPASERKPRTEVADFIIADLDKAIENLYDRSVSNGQRLNKQAAQVFQSRVALFEATFEKYHKGSGRVPGDNDWPGKNMSYNSGKTFDIDAHVKTLLNKAMSAAKPVADALTLTENSHVISPAPGKDYDWNPYFEMFSQPRLDACNEVLLWKEYNAAFGINHDVPYRVLNGNCNGYTRNFVQSFLCKDGLPIYASAQYQGDDTYKKIVANRDERLQLFIWSDQRTTGSDYFDVPGITNGNTQIRCLTGYQARKYYTYDEAQTPNDNKNGTNACPVFRATEAMLNYMEASAELNNGQPDNTAFGYWQKLRERAGVNTDISATVSATDLAKEYDNGNGDFGVYSGSQTVNAWVYNVRRERLNEMFSEGLRRLDLVRWRSYDNMINTKWIPEGVNFWTSIYQVLNAKEIAKGESGAPIKDDFSDDANVSPRSASIYLRPYSIHMRATDELANGFKWTEAYYLSPLGVSDLTSASPDRTVETSMLYQNINWPAKTGHAIK